MLSGISHRKYLLPQRNAARDHHFIADRSILIRLLRGEHERFALDRLQTLFTENKVVIAVGGSGMYIDALLNGLDPLPTNADIKADLDEQFAADGLAVSS